jgi:hypothetical protein
MPAREPLTEEEILEKLSGWIVKRGLTTPAILVLETHRHMNFVASQVVVFLQPMLTVLFDSAGIETVVRMMEKRENVERLLIRIEQKDQELLDKQRAEKAARKEARRARREEKRAARLARKAARRAERDMP